MKKFLALSLHLLISSILLAQSLPAYLPSNGLVAWYPFNGNANDESGNGNNFINSNFQFNSSNPSLDSSASIFGTSAEITYLSSLSNYQEYTLSLSFYLINGEAIIWFGSNDISTLTLSISENGIGFGSNDAYTPSWNSPPITTNSWNQLTITKSNIGEMNFLINSQPYGPFYWGYLANNNPCLLSFNGSSTCSSNSYFQLPFQGWMNNSDIYFDNITIYNRRLSSTEIQMVQTQSSNVVNNSAIVPPGIPYQAVVRNANGSVAANTAVTTRFTLHQTTADGTVEYQETHALTTNAQGLMATVLGQGTAVQNTFAAINWANTTKFLQVEVDLGNGYVDLGTQQLMSVPYALYAANGPQGAQGPAGPQGPAGADGVAGAMGVSVTSITTSGSNFLITLSDGTIQTVPIPASGNSSSGSNSNTLIYTITGF